MCGGHSRDGANALNPKIGSNVIACGKNVIDRVERIRQFIPKRPIGPTTAIDLLHPDGTIERLPDDQLEALEIVLRVAQPVTFCEAPQTVTTAPH